MNEQTLGVLLVSGKLTHQEMYGLQFQNDRRCRLIAVTDELDIPAEREQLNREFAQELGLPYIADLTEGLAREDVHLVSICAEPERRGRIVAQCAEAGKHVYIDKPITPDLNAADAVVNAVSKNKVRSQMFSHISQPWLQRAKRIVESGELGELVALHADCLFAKGPAGTAQLGPPRQAIYPPIISNFVDAKAELYAMGVYALGQVCWLAQRSVQSVYARTANYFFEAHQRHNMEDLGFMVMTLEGGITATITGGRAGWTSHPDGGKNQVYLIGTAGSMLIDAYGPRLEVYDGAAPWTPPPIHPRDPMGFWGSAQREAGVQPKRIYKPLTTVLSAQSDESHFVDCIVEGREPGMNAYQAAMLTEVLLAGYKSAATGDVVTLPLARV